MKAKAFSEVIMRTWVKNSVKIIAHGPRLPIIGLSELGNTVPKRIRNYILTIAIFYFTGKI